MCKKNQNNRRNNEYHENRHTNHRTSSDGGQATAAAAESKAVPPLLSHQSKQYDSQHQHSWQHSSRQYPHQNQNKQYYVQVFFTGSSNSVFIFIYFSTLGPHSYQPFSRRVCCCCLLLRSAYARHCAGALRSEHARRPTLTPRRPQTVRLLLLLVLRYMVELN